MKIILEATTRSFVLSLLVAHCATNADSGSQTHWLAVCSQDSDCGQGLVCRCGRCTKTCTGDTCSDLPRQADCVPASSDAHTALCGSRTDDAICLAACGDGCISNETCIAGACVPRHSTTLPDGRTTWHGAPCEECNLETQVARLADGASEDCGRVSLDAGNTDGADCAFAALQGGRPFTLIADQTGTDSTVAVAWVFAAGHFYMVTYDSNVCGGTSPTCETVGCGPRITRTTCFDPKVSTTAPKTIECGPQTQIDPQTICGPDPSCNAGACF